MAPALPIESNGDFGASPFLWQPPAKQPLARKLKYGVRQANNTEASLKLSHSRAAYRSKCQPNGVRKTAGTGSPKPCGTGSRLLQRRCGGPDGLRIIFWELAFGRLADAIVAGRPHMQGMTGHRDRRKRRLRPSIPGGCRPWAASPRD